MTTDDSLADVLAEHAHDGPFCGHPTRAGIPCQRRALSFGRCARHTSIVKTIKAINATPTLAHQPKPANRRARSRARRTA